MDNPRLPRSVATDSRRCFAIKAGVGVVERWKRLRESALGVVGFSHLGAAEGVGGGGSADGGNSGAGLSGVGCTAPSGCSIGEAIRREGALGCLGTWSCELDARRRSIRAWDLGPHKRRSER